MAERIRSNIEKKHFMVNGEGIYLTCSFGVYMVDGKIEGMTVDDVIELVDKRSYSAKRLGRNRVK